jgi:hypothetical protein
VPRSGRPCRALAAEICTGDSCCVHFECSRFFEGTFHASALSGVHLPVSFAK